MHSHDILLWWDLGAERLGSWVGLGHESATLCSGEVFLKKACIIIQSLYNFFDG